MLKVFAFRCWRFLLLLLDAKGLWFLIFFLFAYIIKRNDVNIYSILFKSWLYKFSLTYNDERFMKSDF
jgi:hypothetical protein